jgi:hypothetical protein
VRGEFSHLNDSFPDGLTSGLSPVEKCGMDIFLLHYCHSASDCDSHSKNKTHNQNFTNLPKGREIVVRCRILPSHSFCLDAKRTKKIKAVDGRETVIRNTLFPSAQI